MHNELTNGEVYERLLSLAPSRTVFAPPETYSTEDIHYIMALLSSNQELASKIVEFRLPNHPDIDHIQIPDTLINLAVLDLHDTLLRYLDIPDTLVNLQSIHIHDTAIEYLEIPDTLVNLEQLVVSDFTIDNISIPSSLSVDVLLHESTDKNEEDGNIDYESLNWQTWQPWETNTNEQAADEAAEEEADEDATPYTTVASLADTTEQEDDENSEEETQYTTVASLANTTEQDSSYYDVSQYETSVIPKLWKITAKLYASARNSPAAESYKREVVKIIQDLETRYANDDPVSNTVNYAPCSGEFSGMSAAWMLAYIGAIPEAIRLLDLVADPNERPYSGPHNGKSILFLALQHITPMPIIKKLLSYSDIDVNVRCVSRDRRDRYSNLSVLHDIFARYPDDCAQLVEMLIDEGIFIHTKLTWNSLFGLTPLFYAILYGRNDAAKILIQHTKSLHDLEYIAYNKTIYSGKSLLCTAACLDNWEIFKALLTKGVHLDNQAKIVLFGSRNWVLIKDIIAQYCYDDVHVFTSGLPNRELANTLLAYNPETIEQILSDMLGTIEFHQKFICPKSKQVILFPVTLTDGICYERAAIQKLLMKSEGVIDIENNRKFFHYEMPDMTIQDYQKIKRYLKHHIEANMIAGYDSKIGRVSSQGSYPSSVSLHESASAETDDDTKSATESFGSPLKKHLIDNIDNNQFKIIRTVYGIDNDANVENDTKSATEALDSPFKPYPIDASSHNQFDIRSTADGTSSDTDAKTLSPQYQQYPGEGFRTPTKKKTIHNLPEYSGGSATNSTGSSRSSTGSSPAVEMSGGSATNSTGSSRSSTSSSPVERRSGETKHSSDQTEELGFRTPTKQISNNYPSTTPEYSGGSTGSSNISTSSNPVERRSGDSATNYTDAPKPFNVSNSAYQKLDFTNDNALVEDQQEHGHTSDSKHKNSNQRTKRN